MLQTKHNLRLEMKCSAISHFRKWLIVSIGINYNWFVGCENLWNTEHL